MAYHWPFVDGALGLAGKGDNVNALFLDVNFAALDGLHKYIFLGFAIVAIKVMHRVNYLFLH